MGRGFQQLRWRILPILAVFQGVFWFAGMLVFTRNLALAAKFGGLAVAGTLIVGAILFLLGLDARSVSADRAQLDREFARIQWRIPPIMAVCWGVLMFVGELVWGSHNLVLAAEVGVYWLAGAFVVSMIVLLVLFPPPREHDN